MALVLAGAAISYLFAVNVEQRVHDGLTATMTRLIAAIDPDDLTNSLTQPLRDPRYETPFGGLYWQVSNITDGDVVRSRSLWDYELTAVAPDDGAPQFLVLDGPDNQTLTALAQQIRFPTASGATQPYLAVVAEDRASLSASVYRFGSALAIALGILGIVLAGAAWLQVRLGLRPLGAIRAGIERIRNRSEERLTGDFPSEVQPLINEVNDLLRSQEAAIEFARARAADLAHGLKTPLSVLATTSSGLRSRGEEETADLVDELTADMVDKIDYQLRLSRLRLRTRAEHYSASITEALDKAIGVLKRTRAGEELRWDVKVEDGLAVDLDSRDLIELVGVILENAAKWARTQVTVRAARRDAMAAITIEDDGPGLPADPHEAIAKRGVRLDESKSGSGLGLAIAREIVGLNHGAIDFKTGANGGLCVELTLPVA